jgi:hypothetical protein
LARSEDVLVAAWGKKLLAGGVRVKK